MTFWLNGAFKDDPHAVSIADRGFLLGDGLFETILVVDGVPAFLNAHIARLSNAMKALSFDASIDEAIGGVVGELAKRNGLQTGFAAARLMVSRGAGGRGLAFPETPPTILVTIHNYAPPDRDGPARLMVSQFRRSETSLSSRFKTLNYLDNTMARHEADGRGCDEAIMLNSAGRVACASAANIFVIAKDGRIITPPVREGALPGVIRSLLLREEAKEAEIEPALLEKTGLFITNSLIGLRGACLGGKPAASQPAHNVVQRLQAWYDGVLQTDLEHRASKL